MACNQELREQGKPYPRTCQDCRLGPCHLTGGKPVGRIATLDAIIARLTAELAESRDKNGALIEMVIWQIRSSVPGHMLVGDTERICAAIRALDPDATSALAARDKRVREDERRRASTIVSEECLAVREGKLCDAIHARLDQRKEAE